MDDKKCIIFGSNFGYLSHYQAVSRIKKIKKIFVYSPNIKKKEIPKDINKVEDIKNNNDFFYLATIATPPKQQKKICYDYVDKKTKNFFLEKPLTENYIETKKLLKKFKEKKIKYYINFIYPNIDNFKYFKKVIQNKKIKFVTYTWKFKQAYFKNKIKTWKIVESDGGGLINYYLIHLFYNLLFFFDSFNISKIKLNKKKTKLELDLISKKGIKIKLLIDNCSNENIHHVKVENSKNIYELKNLTKNWTKNFKVFHNSKKLFNKLSRNKNRFELTYENICELLKNKTINKKLKFFELAHKYCDIVINNTK